MGTGFIHGALCLCLNLCESCLSSSCPPWTITSCCMFSFPRVSFVYLCMCHSQYFLFDSFLSSHCELTRVTFFIVRTLTYSHVPFWTVNISVFYKYVWLYLNFHICYIWYHGNPSCLALSLWMCYTLWTFFSWDFTQNIICNVNCNVIILVTIGSFPFKVDAIFSSGLFCAAPQMQIVFTLVSSPNRKS